MGRINIDIADEFYKAFGRQTTIYKIDPLPARKNYADLGSPYYKTNLVGREYYMPVKLGGVDLHNPVMRVSCQKTIVETEMQGRRGKVKELISIDDYVFTISCFIVTPDNNYPEAEVKKIIDLYEINAEVEMRSPISDLILVTQERMGFDKVVIYDIEWPEVSGVGNVRPYRLTVKSDEPFDLYID